MDLGYTELTPIHSRTRTAEELLAHPLCQRHRTRLGHTNCKYCKEYRRSDAIAELRSLGVTVVEEGPKWVVINNLFTYDLVSFRWRRFHINKWYRSQGPKDFVTRFVNKPFKKGSRT